MISNRPGLPTRPGSMGYPPTATRLQFLPIMVLLWALETKVISACGLVGTQCSQRTLRIMPFIDKIQSRLVLDRRYCSP